jgi:DNA-directed RNA polymerase subunit RPC12/RpoP/tetratricopeptide (TPR) repeat protein
MRLVSAKCPDCGAGLKIPEGSTSVTCEYCGGNIMVTDVLGATDVMQNCMTLAYSAMESKNYKEAYDHFNRAIEIDMKNPNAWFGKAVCLGMTGKLRDNSFGQMIDMFENSFSYAPEDKQANFRKNASAEIVKVVRNASSIIRFGVDLLLLKDDTALSAEIEQEVKKVKDTVENTVKKALEYDAVNADAAVLMGEITSGKFFQSDLDVISNKEANALEAALSPAPETKSLPSNQPVMNQPSVNSKKSGCSFVVLVMIMTAAAAGLIMGMILP